MIPSEVAAIASLIFSKWVDAEPEAQREIIDAAYRIYDAGYRLASPTGQREGQT